MLSRKVWLKSGEDNDTDDGLKVSSCINAALVLSDASPSLHACTRVSNGLDLTHLVVQRPGPPPSRPQLTPSPDQRRQHVDRLEDEALGPGADEDPMTVRQQVRLTEANSHCSLSLWITWIAIIA